MSNVYEIHGRDHRLEEAGEWIARLDRGLSGEEINRLRRWMSEDHENQRVLSDMARLWDQMDTLTRLTELFPEPLPAEGTASKRWMAVAASVAIVVMAGLASFYIPNPVDEASQNGVAIIEKTQLAVYETAIGGLSKFQLSDSSQLTLNTNSHIEVAFTARERRIRLNRGGLHIDVSHDPNRPLNVIVGDRVFQAVGTAFTVKIDENQKIELLVTDGKVVVGIAPREFAEGAELNSEQPLEIYENSPSFSMGEHILLHDSGTVLTTLEPQEIEVQLSWREGNLVFRGESLGEAATEISRYTPVEFVFLDEELQKVRVAGLFKAGDVSGFLSSLRANFDIAYERIDDKTIQLYAFTGDNN